MRPHPTSDEHRISDISSQVWNDLECLVKFIECLRDAWEKGGSPLKGYHFNDFTCAVTIIYRISYLLQTHESDRKDIFYKQMRMKL